MSSSVEDPASVLLVVPVDPWSGVYDVLSERSSRTYRAVGAVPEKAVWYRAQLSAGGGGSCSCAAGLRGVPCKHLRACRVQAGKLQAMAVFARSRGIFQQWRAMVLGHLATWRRQLGLPPFAGVAAEVA